MAVFDIHDRFEGLVTIEEQVGGLFTLIERVILIEGTRWINIHTESPVELGIDRVSL